jgi:hypothetical protein
VHPEAKSERLVPHPIGTNTSLELVAYNADVAEGLVRVAKTVVAALSYFDLKNPSGAGLAGGW